MGREGGQEQPCSPGWFQGLEPGRGLYCPLVGWSGGAGFGCPGFRSQYPRHGAFSAPSASWPPALHHRSAWRRFYLKETDCRGTPSPAPPPPVWLAPSPMGKVILFTGLVQKRGQGSGRDPVYLPRPRPLSQGIWAPPGPAGSGAELENIGAHRCWPCPASAQFLFSKRWVLLCLLCLWPLAPGGDWPFLRVRRWTQPARWRSWRQTASPCRQQPRRAAGEEPGSRSSSLATGGPSPLLPISPALGL